MTGQLEPLGVLRSVLEAQRLAGQDFDTAWSLARRQALGCARTQGAGEATLVAKALHATRPEWQGSYDRTPDAPLRYLKNIGEAQW